MERLTFEGNFCAIAQCRDSACKQDGTCTQRLVWERLEDAGLSPQACAEAREIEETLSGYDYSISRMVELMKADVEGRVVVLPCKVGDTVWFKTYKNNARDCIGVQPHEVTRISASIIVPGEIVDISIPVEQIGVRVFLSEAEAVAADAKPPAGNAILEV